ncbi:MAG TPA: hypothetical protein VGH99_20990 [Pseudonocardia sp.]
MTNRRRQGVVRQRRAAKGRARYRNLPHDQPGPGHGGSGADAVPGTTDAVAIDALAPDAADPAGPAQAGPPPPGAG